VLTATILASSLDFIDGSVVNVGLAAIGHDFDANAANLQWVINAYLLPLSALLLLGGAAGDRFGRRLLIVGIVIFAAASVASARLAFACRLTDTNGHLRASTMLSGASPTSDASSKQLPIFTRRDLFRGRMRNDGFGQSRQSNREESKNYLGN
jgi:MFS family permease